MSEEYQMQTYSKGFRVPAEWLEDGRSDLAKTLKDTWDMHYLALSNPAEYARIMNERRAERAERERRAWLGIPLWRRGYILLGRWLRKHTLGIRQRIIGWLAWDDMERNDDLDD